MTVTRQALAVNTVKTHQRICSTYLVWFFQVLSDVLPGTNCVIILSHALLFRRMGGYCGQVAHDPGATGGGVICAVSHFRVLVKVRIRPSSRCIFVKLQLARRKTKGVVTCQVSSLAEDRVGCTRDFCAACWTEHGGGVRSMRTFKLEQALRRQRGSGKEVSFTTFRS